MTKRRSAENHGEGAVGLNANDWRGDPIYRVPSACHDERNTYRVFHRDLEGRCVAEFYGDRAREMAERFCELFGEPSGSRGQL